MTRWKRRSRAQVENAARLTAAEAMLAALLNPAPATPSTPAADPFNPDAGKEQIRFDDVSDNAWYASAVRYAVENGLMNGTGTGKFSPGCIHDARHGHDHPCTHGRGGHQRHAVVRSGHELGEGERRLRRDEPPASVTREQLVTMLFRYAAAHGMEP